MKEREVPAPVSEVRLEEPRDSGILKKSS